MSCFEQDMKAMAVAPSVIVNGKKTFVQYAQKAEYNMGIYLKKMLAFLGGINVTPGPFTVFRVKVFSDLGPYRQGHNTEDMEIAYRMQKNQYKIEHCNDAYVYTNTPQTAQKLYKQRLRWIYGFINNTIDYRGVLLKKKYGNFSFFTLPMGIISILSVCYLFSKILFNLGDFLYSKISFLQVLGPRLTITSLGLNPFFFNLQPLVLLVILLYVMIIFAMIVGKRMTEGKWGLSLDMVYFFPVFGVVAPIGVFKATYNTILRRKPSWR